MHPGLPCCWAWNEVSADVIPSERDNGKTPILFRHEMTFFLFSSQHGWSVQEALLSLWKPEIPIRGGWSASQREVSVSFNWGGGGKEEERSEGIEDAGKLPSGAGVCQQQAAPMHTVGKCGPAWAGPGLRKTNQAYNGKYTDKRVCVTVHSHTTTNAPFLANRESFKTFFLTLNASPLHKTQKSGVHLPKIKPYLHHWVKNVQFANCVLYKWTLRLFGHLLISRKKNTFPTFLISRHGLADIYWSTIFNMLE